MRNKLLTLFFSLSFTMSYAQGLSPTDFRELNSIKAEVGKSSRKLKGAKFEELYKAHDRELFKEKMFEYLSTSNYKNIDDYFWYSHFFMDDYYNTIINKELVIEILKKGKIEIENRLKKNNSEEQTFYFSMTRCQVLWQTGVYYFNENDIKKGGAFFDLAYSNPDCIHAFPGTTKEKKEIIYKKYSQYKKQKNE